MDRRTFIKLTAVTGTSATLAGCSVPQQQGIRFVPEEELAPGIAEWKPSVCPICSSGCGVNVRVMRADVETTKDGQAGVVRMGVAKKLEGFPTHPVNQGGLCARGQAAIQFTYHPDRIVQPLKRTGERGAGTFQAISWDEAIGEVVKQLDALASAGNGQGLAIVTGGRRNQRQQVFEQFAAKFGAAAPITYELFSDDVLRHANAMSFGYAQLPTYDLANSAYVLGLGADFLGTWNSPVANAKAFGEMRGGRVGMRGAFVQVESRISPTGASADEWVAANPGTEGALALGLAHVILREKLRSADAGRAGALIDGWAAGLPDYTPEKVSTLTGVSAKRIERLAREFAERSPAVAIVGGTPLAHTNGLFTALAVNALNQLAGSVGQKGGLLFTPQLARPAAGERRTLAQLASGNAPRVLIVDDANPVFSAPKSWNLQQGFAKVPFIVSFAQFIDETSALADVILPDSTFLESWVDAAPESGSAAAVISVAAPAMKPLFQTRPTGDVVLEISRKLQKPLELPWQTYQDVLKATLAPAGEDAFTAAQKQSGWWGELPKTAAVQPTAADPKAVPVKYAAPAFQGDAGEYPYMFLPYASAAFLDGSLAHLPWMQELPDPMTSGMWCSWVEINPKTAEKLGIGLGDEIDVTSNIGVVRAPAFLNPGLAPDIIAMPVGQGHTNFTRYASNRGANPVSILAPVAHAETGSLAWAATRVKIARVSEPGSLIVFSARGELRENPREKEGTLMAHRWGMAVDLDRCTGCEACVAACRAENNIPTVGDLQSSRGRAMHWIRVERYFEGDFPEVRVKYRPVMCQQCDAAPCEPVCPTYASHHSDEGLNAQIYNRCIGTRYCANACPYNARFFDFFNPVWEKPLHLQLNPDVSLREVGVMEKCTFCTQRIAAGKDAAAAEKARSEGRRHRAGLRSELPLEGARIR
ncbi:MAG: molybdopterin-dependent oxidoreductase [Vicinamibacterales bacterium]